MTSTVTITANFSSLVEYFQSDNIRIIGTVDEPLFHMTDVAEHIGDTANVHRTTKEFDETLKVKAEFNDGIQNRNACFLTEDGLYEYLMIAPGKESYKFRIMVRNILKQIRKQVVDEVRLKYKLLLTRMVQNSEFLKEVLCFEKPNDPQEKMRYLMALWFIDNATNNKNMDFKYEDITDLTHRCLLDCTLESYDAGSTLDDRENIEKLLDEAVINKNRKIPLRSLYNHDYHIKRLERKRQ
jgi:prophage antirepressor-like protein